MQLKIFSIFLSGHKRSKESSSSPSGSGKQGLSSLRVEIPPRKTTGKELTVTKEKSESPKCVSPLVAVLEPTMFREAVSTAKRTKVRAKKVRGARAKRPSPSSESDRSTPGGAEGAVRFGERPLNLDDSDEKEAAPEVPLSTHRRRHLVRDGSRVVDEPVDRCSSQH